MGDECPPGWADVNNITLKVLQDATKEVELAHGGAGAKFRTNDLTKEGGAVILAVRNPG